MKNLLVSKHYKIKDHTKWYGDRTNEDGLEENYDKMMDLMLDSAEANLLCMDDYIVHEGEADNIREVFKIHFYEIYELWKQGNNILYADSDVLFVKPVDYFTQFVDRFVMFNYTDPPGGTTCDHYGISFEHFYNCGIRYYPHNMDQSVWDRGIEMVENWNPERWNSEQVIYNEMMWMQDFPGHFFRPELAYQLVDVDTQRSHRNNRMSLDDAYAVHFHGSRGSGDRLNIMTIIADAIGIR
jgi:hypothetical protein